MWTNLTFFYYANNLAVVKNVKLKRLTLVLTLTILFVLTRFWQHISTIFLVILLKTWLGDCLQLLANMDMILLKISTKRKSAQLN